ncbi:MAG: dipicolinate synthase subunit B [Oscillospiraceae bacterium]|nr:dipicolinate synthase subunit B [Oscillospiraceae bacterium]
MKKIKIGFAMCGSFCTFDDSIKQLERLVSGGYDVTPIMSFNAYSIDTRFGKAADFVRRIEQICGRPVIRTIEGAEPAGPGKLYELVLVSPCTGNTLAKLANSITDTPVTMAVKSQIRNSRPALIAISTNDALSGNSRNIGVLLNSKNYYFVPLHQDDPHKKPTSLIANFELIPSAAEAALNGLQLQPMFV